MNFGDSDLGTFFSDFGVAVVYEGQTANGIFGMPSDVFAGPGPSGIEEHEFCVQLPFNAFSPAPKPKDSITVDSTAYKVKGRKYLGDGKVMELCLLLA